MNIRISEKQEEIYEKVHQNLDGQFNDKRKILDLISKIRKIDRSVPLSEAENLLIACITYISKIRPNLSPTNPLSIIETLCIILLAVGKNPEGSADLLGISPNTIKTYEQRIRDKLGARNRTHAFYLALIKGYISIENE